MDTVTRSSVVLLLKIYSLGRRFGLILRDDGWMDGAEVRDCHYADWTGLDWCHEWRFRLFDVRSRVRSSADARSVQDMLGKDSS